MKKESALVVTPVLGSTLTRKKEQILFVHPLKDLVKEPRTERDLEDETRGKEMAKPVADAQNQERGPLLSLLEAHRLRGRKTGRHAEITLWDPARAEASAITGIHQYAETGVLEHALMTESAHFSTRRNLSERARNKARHLLRQMLSLKRNQKQKVRQELAWLG